MKRMKKTLVLFMCVVILSVALFSILFVVVHRGHSCTGYGCVVCIQLIRAKDNLNQLGHSIPARVMMPMAITLVVSIVLFNDAISFKTPVSLKIRLDY